MIVWLILLGIILLLFGIIALVKVFQRQIDKEIADTADWAEAEATIHNGRIDQHDRYHWFPYLQFSYVAAGEYLSGEFCLEAEGDKAHEMIKRLTGSKFTINYDPRRPTSWYIPDETMEGSRILF